VDEPDGHRIEEVQFLAAAAPGHHEAGLFQDLQVLHDAEPSDLKPGLQRAERLAVLAEERVQQVPSDGVGESLEYGVHRARIGDHLVTCQRYRGR